jgi:hypothetical protein
MPAGNPSYRFTITPAGINGSHTAGSGKNHATVPRPAASIWNHSKNNRSSADPKNVLTPRPEGVLYEYRMQ